jgi:hypothetical protein
VSSGWRYGTMMTVVPISIVFVSAASHPSVVHGS